MAKKKKKLTTEERTKKGVEGQTLREAIGTRVAETPEYAKMFKDVYTEDLGQPIRQQQTYRGMKVLAGGGADPGDIEKQAISTLYNLAGQFIESYIDKTGEVPSDADVEGFLKGSVTRGVAAKSFTGELKDTKRIVEPAVTNLVTQRELADAEELEPVETKADIGALAEKTATERMSLADKLAEIQTQEGTRELEGQFGEARRRMIREESALGRLQQPVSVTSAANLEAAHQRGLADLISRIRSGQIGTKSAISGESLGAIQRAREFDIGSQQQAGEFGLRRRSLAEQIRMYDLNRQDAEEARYQTRVDERLARQQSERLGQLQAEASKPGTLDYINTAIGGLSAIGDVAGGFGTLRSTFGKKKSKKKVSGGEVV